MWISGFQTEDFEIACLDIGRKEVADYMARPLTAIVILIMNTTKVDRFGNIETGEELAAPTRQCSEIEILEDMKKLDI